MHLRAVRGTRRRPVRAWPALWAGGAYAYRGVAAHGFPNLFLPYGPSTNLGSSSILYMLESQIRYVEQALAFLRDKPGAVLEVTREAERRYVDWVAAESQHTVWESGCHSWYTQNGRNVSNWPTWVSSYRRLMRVFDRDSYALVTG